MAQTDADGYVCRPSFSVGGNQFELTYLGNGHGDDLIATVVRPENVALVIDAVSPRRLPSRDFAGGTMAQGKRSGRGDGMMQKLRAMKSRRQAMGIVGSLALSVGWPAKANAIATPAQTEGPFYPSPAMRFPDIDNDLVKIDGKVIAAGGEIVTLKGRVLDSAGRPVSGARVEIWQCDTNGRYIHTGDRGGRERDPGFQGFGHYVTAMDGRYTFRTIKPVAYTGRTPHIHVKVVHPDFKITTQFYISGHGQNSSDRLFRRLSGSEQEAVSMVFVRTANGFETTVDIQA